MKADYLTFKRATNVSLLGLVLQLGMGLALLIYALIARDAAAETGAFLVLAGAAVWLTLAIVFDQHRRERIEALELEGLAASGARDASVFAERDDDLRVAAKRLAWMHRILVPSASLVIAAALVGVGIWRLRVGRGVTFADRFTPPPEQGWAMGMGISLALIGFLFARFVSGMAKQPVWANLRAGAAQAVAAALVGLLIAVAQFVNFAGWDAVLRYLPVAFPIAMFVLAAEIVLNFLLGIYRPRKPGEIPRPAMESRVLGFVAAPDRIAESIGGALNYQFGFDVTGSWFYQLLSRFVVALVLVGVLVLWGMTSLGVVQPNERAIRVRFGQRVGETLGPGLYAKLPWPLERLSRLDAQTVRVMDLGNDPPETKGRSILWTNDHGVQEFFFVVQPSEADRAAAAELDLEAPGLVRDVALVAAEVTVHWRVDDLLKFEQFAAPETRQAQIRAIGQREVFAYLATESVDRVLGRGRTEASEAIRRRIERAYAEMDAGVAVQFVGIEGVHPPRDTAESFEDVVKSAQNREAAITQAQTEAIERLTRVAGSVDTARRLVRLIDQIEKNTLDLDGRPPAPGADAQGRRGPAATERVAKLEAELEDLLAQAGGAAGSAVQQARADRWVRHMSARGTAERYEGQLASYQAAPAVYAAHIYFQTLRDIMKEARVYVAVDDSGKLELRTNLEDQSTGGSIFAAPPKAEE